ncbi:MAG: hypothetical protein ACXABD_18700 [Candidatus Thorarchaeota archaeon]|jgi:hypothetical protein
MQEQLTVVQPEEVLTWTQIVYYGAGALVALCVAYLKLRQIRRKKNNAE